MKIRLLVCVTAVMLILGPSAYPQLISRKESAGVDSLLARLSESHQPGRYLIRNVTVISMTDVPSLPAIDVLVENGLISEIAPNISAENATIIEGEGRYLMPGLTDMHVHLFTNHQMKNTWLLLLLINGVTTVRDMAGEPEKLELRNQLRANQLLGPDIYQSGPLLNGTPSPPGAIRLVTPAEAVQEVNRQHQAGYDFIKVYNDLSEDVYIALCEEAARIGMPVVGHTPASVTLPQALRYQTTIEHLTGYLAPEPDGSLAQIAPANYAALTSSAATWNCPTLFNLTINWDKALAVGTFQQVTPYLPSALTNRWGRMLKENSRKKEALLERHGAQNTARYQEVVRMLYQSGSPLLAGTDAGNLPLLVPGFSLHAELEALAAAGIPPAEVLRMATVNAARALGASGILGTIEEGKRADLLLLDRNPLEELGALTDLSGVMLRGIWLDRATLEAVSARIRQIFGQE